MGRTGLVAPRREGSSQIRTRTRLGGGLYSRAPREAWDAPAFSRLQVVFSIWVSETANDVVCLNADEVTLVQAEAFCLFANILGEIFGNRNLDRYSRDQRWQSPAVRVACATSNTWLSQFSTPPRAVSVPLYPDLQNSPGFSSRALLALEAVWQHVGSRPH